MLLHFFWNLVALIFALGILITIHECGHFIAARILKVKVERFSIGFGPILWSRRDSNDTEYAISAVLFGGYVKLYNTQEKSIYCNKGNNNAFNCQHIWKKSIIVASGPIFNFIFSILLYVIIFIIGMPVYKPIIHSIIPNSIIAQSGIQSGVEITSINNIQTHDWDSVRLEIFNSIGKEKLIISTTPINDTCIKTYAINLSRNWFNNLDNTKDPIITLGILPFNTNTVPILSGIKPNSSAEQAGLKIGDKIISIDNQLMHHWKSVITAIKNNPEKSFKISVERENEIINLNVTPNKKNMTHSDKVEDIIGVVPKIISDIPTEYYTIHQYSLYTAILQAFKKTWTLICLTTNTLFKLITGDIRITHLGGPIAIAKGARESAQSGLIYYLMFLSLISINLGIVNLLPFPTLDGGHLFFFIIEKIKGKTISKKIQNFSYIIGSIMLILIMCLACFNDLSRL
ncbi:sigma E protease regulator RseP [Blochmannia endosymbiont of Camponotus sp.]|uniref:sigma E protease regulator RseP n=1 Tax=Blochmannia endosymbiont of Camponotus sp. TaxID=700220 RepID=UPI002024F400|nr:sigma E protease regulator RseP [Blochmannia endosymbiont of Camponotus sp.]URJ31006.1 sigma E protease regulator RseP [Blochmannia endosymbiont of Camponotus sp.]